MAQVYILEGKRFYIGSTDNLIDRLKDHRRGNTPTTKRIGNWILAWKKEVKTLKIAREMERKIKRWKNRKMIEYLIQGKIDIQ